jgi:hypothetical protein
MNITDILELIEREELDEETFALLLNQLPDEIKIHFITGVLVKFNREATSKKYELYLYVASLPLGIKQQALIDAIKKAQ